MEKGKTTAALGLAVRAAGAGLKVYFCQFLKGRSCSELTALACLSSSITVSRSGSKSFVYKPTDSDRRSARRCFIKASVALASNAYDVVILDEVITVAVLGIIDIEELLDMLRSKPVHVEVVCTGRDAPKALLELADLVTEMKDIKHYYNMGVVARTGIEK